jgi:ring-1,2-phenylacetyl-CoA epoxidase subunit PaaC
LWPYTGELCCANDVQKAMMATGIAPDPASVEASWKARVAAVVEEATITLPGGTFMHKGGIDGTHTEHLGYILSDLQFMQRAYPNMEW